jgi:hypothetical protein
MKICGRDYKLRFSRKASGGSFWCSGKKSEGRGEIEIGHYKDLRGCAEILCHEALESIFAEDNVRYSNTSYDIDNNNRIFHFDHRYFDSIGPKLLDALLTSGMFRMVDCRPKLPVVKKKTKKGK